MDSTVDEQLVGTSRKFLWEELKPVYTGDYSRRFWRQFVAENGDCRRKRRQTATVAVFVDSVDRAL